MAACAQCTTANKDTARFCRQCGAALPVAVLPVTAPPATFYPGVTGRLPPNAILSNRYLIVRKIGQGGMAAVYQVADTMQPGTVWAVKEMSDSAIMSPHERPAALRAFQQEASLLRSLDHPNLPKVIDVFDEGGKHYLVMEYVPGATLAQVQQERGSTFTEAEVLPMALQLCDVLSYLHSRGIIFRDLKPGNVMLLPTGQIKLIDFGIVRFFKLEGTHDTIALGTLGYAAPEAHNGQTDARSDLYSLCVTLHELLTGHDPSTTLYDLPSVRHLNPAVSPALEQVLLRGLQRQRDYRWASANDMRAGLMQTVPAASGGPFGVGRVPLRAGGGQGPTSRPTTRLLMAATQLSPRQLALAVAGVTVALIVTTWVLVPVLASLPIDWNSVPIMGVFGALGYAALRRAGATLAAHSVLTFAMVGTIYLRLGAVAHYSYDSLLLATLLSGGAMELWVAFIGRVRGQAADAWRRELAWLAGMALVGMVVFFQILTGGKVGLSPLLWMFAAAFGALGWFLGDLAYQYLAYRRAGFRWQQP